MKKLLVATSNPHKLKEMKQLLEGLPYDVLSMKDIDINIIMPEEDGDTFRDNAYIKAKGVYKQIVEKYPDMWVLADDSGMSVDALGDAPGVHSARYKGLSTPEERLKEVLREMEDVPWENRTAHFITVMCLITDFAEVFTEGIVNGYIALEPKGENGFGYDPIFYYPPLDKTYAQMGAEEKNSVSHRGIASRKMKVVLEKFAR